MNKRFEVRQLHQKRGPQLQGFFKIMICQRFFFCEPLCVLWRKQRISHNPNSRKFGKSHFLVINRFLISIEDETLFINPSIYTYITGDKWKGKADSDFTIPPGSKERPPKPSYHDILTEDTMIKSQSIFWSMCFAQRASYKRVVIARSVNLWCQGLPGSNSLSWNESRSSAQTGKRWNKKASFQSSGFRNKSVKSGVQGKVRSENKVRNSKTSDKRQSLRLRNEMIFTPCDCETKELTEMGVKICLKHWWNEKIIHCRIVFWADM